MWGMMDTWSYNEEYHINDWHYWEEKEGNWEATNIVDIDIREYETL